MKRLLVLALVFSVSGLVFAAPKKKAAKPATKTVTENPRPVGKSEEGDFVVEKKSDGSVVKYKKKTTYDFEGTGIEGLYNKPSGSYISNINGVKAKSILRIRENFDAEVVDSARMLK